MVLSWTYHQIQCSALRALNCNYQIRSRRQMALELHRMVNFKGGYRAAYRAVKAGYSNAIFDIIRADDCTPHYALVWNPKFIYDFIN